MKHIGHKKTSRKKYKRIVAAVAGAAIVSSAMLPGVSFAKTPETAPSAQHQEAQKTEGSKALFSSVNSPLSAAKQYADKYGFDARHDRFSLQWRSDTEASVIVRTENGKTYKMRLVRGLDNKWEVVNVRRIETSDVGQRQNDPVQVVKDNAAYFGFDADNDKFTLFSQSGSKATVFVSRIGQDFKVDLERQNGAWVITTIRGIGNGRYPATYTPASLFNYRPAGTTTTPLNQTVLYSTDKFADWVWHEDTYPDDMTFGIFFQHPGANGADRLLPDVILDYMKDVNFDQSFVLTANLGTVAAKGFGIGIEKVVQTGNNITVTVAAKSPAAGDTNLTDTQKYSYISLDRGTFDFARAVNVAFVDRAGHVLGSYTIIPW